ncbi:hypothetical protein SEA_EVAA_51 [Gordonia phage Evaa]|nr:hypothetical protein SEA_EVAA_51 [Gordonia phage Evaa]
MTQPDPARYLDRGVHVMTLGIIVCESEADVRVLPDGALLSWMREPTDPTSQAVGLYRREVESCADGTVETLHWVSPGGYLPNGLDVLTFPLTAFLVDSSDGSLGFRRVMTPEMFYRVDEWMADGEKCGGELPEPEPAEGSIEGFDRMYQLPPLTLPERTDADYRDRALTLATQAAPHLSMSIGLVELAQELETYLRGGSDAERS